MKTREQNDSTSKVKVEPFTIAWPPELDIQPKWKVPVSKTREAWVYEVEEAQENPNTIPLKATMYRVKFVLIKTGKEPRDNNEGYYRHHREGSLDTARDLLQVNTMIERYSQDCQPKTKTVTEKRKVEVNGDDEDE